MKFGSFKSVCRSSTLPICNIFLGNFEPYCLLRGLGHVFGIRIKNPLDVFFASISALVALWLIIRSQSKYAAVGRREMQILILIYFFISICQIFTIGGFITDAKVFGYFTAAHISFIVTFFWVLLLNAIVGYQLFEDGTIFSISLLVVPSILLFVGSGYIILDSMFFWSDTFIDNYYALRNYGAYILYFLWPLVSIVGYFVLEFILVFKVLEEWKPLLLLSGSLVSFIVGQIFNFVASRHICHIVHGKIDGSFIETIFLLISMILLFKFWDSITEDDWEEPMFQETQMSSVPKFDFSP
ncbi:uncharacterized protein T551_01970 [Pneumocystis jirovecii RU7]|uniref:Uncharacterized protein n=1 Tax=Pneumocystis jirovecii (strain RU7) TaxID=1408657 RepID=A0A0W4ZNS2_PNEJ7|nr:uncharacterized protein T551_01970 [Pneumocystis jirovecii RU7]KTW30026.1 hypothetical protein T551_01970 [Pneumocystis jirovecii RU7]